MLLALFLSLALRDPVDLVLLEPFGEVRCAFEPVRVEFELVFELFHLGLLLLYALLEHLDIFVVFLLQLLQFF